MKIRLFSVLALAGLLFCGCAVEDTPAVEGGTILAEMENDKTRTSVTDEGSFTWCSGDKVWLHTTGGGIIGTLSSGAGTSSAQFTYGAFFGDMTGKAVYPYNDGHSLSEDQISFVLPASYDLGSILSNTNAAMYGEVVNGIIKFNHLAGVMRFVFKNVPAGTNKFQLTLDKKINGTFVADLGADYPVLETSATSSASEKTVTLNFDALTTTSDISLYVPLPVGTYTSLGLDLWAGSKSVWSYTNTVTNIISRRTLKLMPAVSMGGTVGGEIEGNDPSDKAPINLSASGTANCYMVSQSGYYMFSPTKGNSSDSVGTIASAEVVWEALHQNTTPQPGDLIRNLKYQDGIISFETTANKGNALIAATDESGTILWSWHIWITDYVPEDDYDTYPGFEDLKVMDRNLGAMSSEKGKMSYGMIYQWGRKDPFTTKNMSSTANTTEQETSANIGTDEYATANPTVFINSKRQGTDWRYESNRFAWGTAKTALDPCPLGWKVPEGDENSLWRNFELGSFDSTYGGMTFRGNDATQDIWMPAQGYIMDHSYSWIGVGYEGRYWTTTSLDATHSEYFGFDSKSITITHDSWGIHCSRANGHVVRCVQE